MENFTFSGRPQKVKVLKKKKICKKKNKKSHFLFSHIEEKKRDEQELTAKKKIAKDRPFNTVKFITANEELGPSREKVL